MHISDSPQSPQIILTKCSKMSEDQDKRHGISEDTDRCIKDDSPKANYVQGGRLKFFKDGKFILELERAQEGQRMSWVSVPRKTFWPPQGKAVSTPTYRQDSSISLSVSDDNSSVQSSPWQREHSWKQLSPRRNQSKELGFCFWRPKERRVYIKSVKRRRPHSSRFESLTYSTTERLVRNNTCNNNKRVRLLAIIQSLIEKTSVPRAEIIVSPRKRFLREIERDNNKVLVDDGCQKRSRNKAIHHQGESSGGSAATTIVKGTRPVHGNGMTTTVEVAVKPTRNSNYSITSLLAEDRNIHRSSNSPSHIHSPLPQLKHFSPTSEDKCLDRFRSMELSQAEKSGSYPRYPLASYFPYMYQFPISPYYGPGGYERTYIAPPVYHAPSIPMSLRHDVPTCSWAVETPEDKERREENITDMPLNLSKHAG